MVFTVFADMQCKKLWFSPLFSGEWPLKHFILLFVVRKIKQSLGSFPKVNIAFWYFDNPLLCLLPFFYILFYFFLFFKTPDRVWHRSGQWDHGHPGPGRWSGGHENPAGPYGGGDQPRWAARHCRGPGAFGHMVFFYWRAWEFSYKKHMCCYISF